MSLHHHHTEHGLIIHHTHANHEVTFSGGSVRPGEGRHDHAYDERCTKTDCKYISAKERDERDTTRAESSARASRR